MATDGGAAFPGPVSFASSPGAIDIERSELGMSLRDYFAAKAMQGLVSDPSVSVRNETINLIATQSYKLADAMLKAREAQGD